MNNLTLLADRKKSTIKKLTKNSKIIKAIINAIQEKKGENIINASWTITQEINDIRKDLR